MKRYAVVVALLAALAAAQERREVQVGIAPAAGPAAAPKKVSPESEKRGRELLARAETQAGGLQDAGMRAYALLQAARSYRPSEKAHAVELLEAALTATREMDAGRTRSRLERQVLEAMVPLAPERADELMSQLDPEGREAVLRALLGYYRKSKQDERAIEMVYRLTAEREFPYAAGGDIMRDLPPAKRGELQQLFTTALTSYREHKHSGMTVGRDFAAIILEFHPQLPPALVKEAIDEVLRQAKQAGEQEGRGRPQQIAVASAQGSVAMGSLYEFRLFQLMPALRAVAPDEAERLLKQHREVAGMLEKYPEGAASLGLGGPPAGGGPRGGGGAMTMVGTGDGVGMPFDRAEMQRMQQILDTADKDPQGALANVATLVSPPMKSAALQGIARRAWKKHPSVARSALRQLVELAPQLPAQEGVMAMRSAAGLYLEMGETADARKVVEKGMESAEKLYKSDTDADDPNKALKAYWPSAEAYRSLLRVAGEISPAWASELLKEVPDDELRIAAEIALARAWMGAPPGDTTIQVSRKSGENEMFMTEGP